MIAHEHAEAGASFAAALRAGDWPQAAHHLRRGQALRTEPKMWALRESDLYLAQRRWDEASICLKRLLAHDSDDEGFQLAVHHNLASMAFAQQDPAGSVAWLGSWMERDGAPMPLPPGFIATRILWVRSLHRAGDLARLHRWVSQCDAAGMLDPHVAGAASLGSWDLGELTTARRWSAMARAALDGSTVPVEAMVTGALLALCAGASAQAHSLAHAAVASDPYDARASMALGAAELAQGQAAASASLFRHATTVTPHLVPAWRGLGWAQFLSGDPDAADGSFASALALDGQDVASLAGLATSLAVRRRDAEASAHVSRCLGLDPDSALARHAQGILRGEAGRHLAPGVLVEALLGRAAAGAR